MRSSGGSKLKKSRASDFPGAVRDLDAAAPEDGRTPLNRYSGGEEAIFRENKAEFITQIKMRRKNGNVAP